MDKEVKRVVSPTDDFKVLKARIMARLRDLVPNGRRKRFGPMPRSIIGVRVGLKQPLNKAVTKGTKKGKKRAKTQRVKEKHVNQEGKPKTGGIHETAKASKQPN